MKAGVDHAPVKALAVSADGRFVAAGDRSGVSIWHVAGSVGPERLTDTGEVREFSWDHQGLWAVDETFPRRYSINIEQLMLKACALANRYLTREERSGSSATSRTSQVPAAQGNGMNPAWPERRSRRVSTDSPTSAPGQSSLDLNVDSCSGPTAGRESHRDMSDVEPPSDRGPGTAAHGLGLRDA